MGATAKSLDFTNVKEGGEFNKKRQTQGDYKAKVMAVKDSPTKDDGTPQWCFTIKVGSGTYPYYCKLVENQLWKIRNLFVAAGLTVPKKKVKVNPDLVVGKDIAVTLEDDEYNGRMQSNLASIFPMSELEGSPSDDEDADDGDDEVEEKPAKKKKAKPVDDEEDEVDDAAKAPRKKSKKGKKGKALEELDIEDM